jgi:hypothetical protein
LPVVAESPLVVELLVVPELLVVAEPPVAPVDVVLVCAASAEL